MANAVLTGGFSITVEYLLFLPGNRIWLFTELVPGALPKDKFAVIYSGGNIRVPIDLITAARLHLIHPGDDSGVGDEQWAWLKLIGLT